MINQLTLKNFTVFPDAELNFGRGLNVIVGENGTGKSHLLKVAYSIVTTLAEGGMDKHKPEPTKGQLQEALALKLRRVFMPDELGRLATRKQGRNRCEVECKFADGPLNTAFSFSTQSKSEVSIDKLPKKWLEKLPVFIPTRELMSIYPNFVSIYDTTSGLELESTWRDTCLLLGALERRGPKEAKIKEFLKPLEDAMGGSVVLDKSGRFYLKLPSGNMEMHLVAEGIRKLGMIARLITTGSLLEKGYLFWDEPEANLNPKVIKDVATTILHLAENGIQVFVATHSLFLLRELNILSEQAEKKLDVRYFGLSKGKDGLNTIEQGESIEDLGDITSLDEELLQSQRFSELA
jgi:predicted ATPase